MGRDIVLCLRQLQLQLKAQRSGHPTSETRFSVGLGKPKIEMPSGGESKPLYLTIDHTKGGLSALPRPVKLNDAMYATQEWYEIERRPRPP